MDLKSLARGAQARAGLKPHPLAVAFEVTHLCNLACHYCDRHTPLPSELTREQILSALAQFIELGMLHISFDGGEPLAHRNIDEIVEFVVSRGVNAVMNTNGILVPKKLDTVRKLKKVKISLDGPEQAHDAMRGKDAFKRALKGAEAARSVGVTVEFTCVIARHSYQHIDELMDIVESTGNTIVFQPARNSLFLDTERDGSGFQLTGAELRAVVDKVAARKRNNGPVGNRWSSLRHFIGFPGDMKLPCDAGWINVTMDPEGCLYHCGQVNRSDKTKNVVSLGVARAFETLSRGGCSQCWCARVVEENYLWGGRVDLLRPITASEMAAARASDR
jgi:MoaA/NifB/PqqE/SkfB family radical SAM enzyme